MLFLFIKDQLGNLVNMERRLHHLIEPDMLNHCTFTSMHKCKITGELDSISMSCSINHSYNIPTSNYLISLDMRYRIFASCH
jgi:hypothetical protein